MSIIYGVFSPSGKPTDPQWITAMDRAAELWPADRRSGTTGSHWHLSCGQRLNTPQAEYARQPWPDQHTGDGPDGMSFHLVFDGRLDNRADLAETLGLSADADTPDEYLIAAAYRQFGTEMGDYLIGDFTIAIIDGKNNSLFLLRDQMGVRPLFIARNGDHIAFASAPAILLALPWVDRTPDQQWLADFLTAIKVDYTTTYYQGIQALQAAHWYQATAAGEQSQRYWDLVERENAAPTDDAACVAEFRRLLFQAVQCRLRTHGAVASELSGGLDSTTVAAIASRLLEPESQPVEAYSHVLHDDFRGKVYPYKDEIEYMRALLEWNPGIRHHEIYSHDRGTMETMARQLRVHAGPYRNDLTQFSDQTGEELQQADIRCLLSGFGGDQLVTSQGGGIYEDLIQDRNHPAIRSLIRSENSPWFRRLAKYVGICLMPGLTLSHMQRGKPVDIDPIIRRKWLQQYGYPARADAHPTRPAAGTVRQREYHVIRSPHVVYRLQDSALGAASYGVDYRYPLLDIRLLQFCLDLNHAQKQRPGLRRRMIRMATTDLLPDKIRLRQDKSVATIPTTHHRYLKDKAAISTLLDDPDVAQYMNSMVDISALRAQYRAMDDDTRPDGKTPARALQLALWVKNQTSAEKTGNKP